jgi:hypothetical protein
MERKAGKVEMLEWMRVKGKTNRGERGILIPSCGLVDLGFGGGSPLTKQDCDANRSKASVDRAQSWLPEMKDME